MASERAQIQVAGIKLIQQAQFWRTAVPFIVAGVQNQVLSKIDGEYRITVYGNGFGINQGNQQYNLQVSFYGQDLPASAVSPLANGVDIILPHAMVDALFFPSQSHRVPLDFHDSIVRECALKYRLIGKIHCTDKYDAVFNVTLAPAIAATATLTSAKNGVANGTVKVVDGPVMQQTPDRDGQDAVAFIGPPFTAPPGWKIREAHLTQCVPTSGDGGECQFNFSPACPVSPDGTMVQCSLVVGSHPHTNRWAITLVQQVSTAFPYPVISYDFPSNRNVSVDISSDADAATLVGSTAQGKPFQVALKPYSASVTDPVYCPQPPVPAVAASGQVLRFTCTASVN